MKKLVLLFLFCIPLVTAFTLDDTTFLTSETNYTAHINESITLDKVRIEADLIEFTNISTDGTFINNNGTYDSVMSFYGLNTSGNIDSLRWDNGTVIGSTPSMNDVNVTVPVNRYLILNTTVSIAGVSQCNDTYTTLTVSSSNKRPYGRLCYYLDFGRPHGELREWLDFRSYLLLLC